MLREDNYRVSVHGTLGRRTPTGFPYTEHRIARASSCMPLKRGARCAESGRETTVFSYTELTGCRMHATTGSRCTTATGVSIHETAADYRRSYTACDAKLAGIIHDSSAANCTKPSSTNHNNRLMFFCERGGDA